MPATYCQEKGDRRVTFFRDERYLVHTISDVAIKYSKGRMIRQQPEGMTLLHRETLAFA